MDEIETFKAQLAQQIDLTERLINDLTVKEKEIEMFKNVRFSFEQTLAAKDAEITQLKNALLAAEKAKINDRRKEIITMWSKKYNVTPAQLSDVERILNSLETDEEINRFESLLGLSLSKEKMTPIPLTKTSEELVVEQFSAQGVTDESLTPEQKVKMLHQRLLKNIK